jgi:hypothetical protein
MYGYSYAIPQNDTNSDRIYIYGNYILAPRYGRYVYSAYVKYMPRLNYGYETYVVPPRYYYSLPHPSSKVKDKLDVR